MANDYDSRSVDIWALKEDAEQSLLPGAVCTGIYKLAQRWALRLLTPKGSMKYNPEIGCDFLAQTYNSEAAVTQAFRFANAEVIQQLRNEDTVATPPDEQIKTVELKEIYVFLNTVSIQVQLISKSNASLPVILPVTYNPI